MNTNGKLYIIDDYYLAAEGIKQAFQGNIVEISDNQKWLIIGDNIEILPDDKTNDLSSIIDILNKDRDNIELVLVNANLKLDESDKRIDKQGIRLTELIRMNPNLKFPIILMSVENSSKILKDARYDRLLKFCCQQIIIQVPFQIYKGSNSLFENINNLYKRISDTPEEKREEEREILAQKLLSEEMEKMNHAFRHFLFSEPIKSSIRIFLGALQAGHIDIQTGNSVLRAMAELEQNISGKKIIIEEYDWNLLRKYLAVKKEELYNAPKYIHPSKKALLIDDECLVSGWAECLKAILRGKNIELVTEPSLTSALALLKHDSEENKTYDFSFILLDLFLGENQPNGLEALRLIKEKQFLIPVIMFTAMDNSQVTKHCIQLGAQGYFVKSLQEDRNSLDYYTKFIEVIEDIDKQKPRADEIQLWRKFTRIENQLNALDNHEIPKLSANNTTLYEGASDCLRKAFYFLSSIRGEVNDYRTMRLLGNNKATLARECIVYAVSAMHRMLVYRIGTDLKKTIDFLIDECIRNRYLNNNFEKYKKHWSLKRGFGRHNFLIDGKNKITFDSSIGCINHVLEFAEDYLKIPDIVSIIGKIPVKIEANI
ncbi:MAG: response regulator, partial [Pseudomonadota bacterium]